MTSALICLEAKGSRAHLVGQPAHLGDVLRYGTGGKPPCSLDTPSTLASGGMGILSEPDGSVWTLMVLSLSSDDAV